MWKEKAKEILLGALIGFWAVLTPVHTLLYVVGALVFADLATGIAKAWRKIEPITSRRLRESVGKSLAYFICVLAAFGLDHILEPGSLLCARAVSVLIAGTEVKSIFENMKDLTGVDLWQALVDKLKPTPKE